MAELDGEAKILILDFLKAYERDQEERQDEEQETDKMAHYFRSIWACLNFWRILLHQETVRNDR